MKVLALAGIFLGLTTTVVAQAPGSSRPSGDVAFTYNYLHSNTQPGDCGCFNLNGGGISASWQLHRRMSAVAEADAGFAGNGPGTGSTITLVNALAGVRYKLPVNSYRQHAPHFFAEVLAGGAHAGGGITGEGDSTYAFMGRVGGGLDQPVSEHLGLRFDAAYVPTTFANGVNDHQNNTLIQTGFVFRWLGRK